MAIISRQALPRGFYYTFIHSFKNCIGDRAMTLENEKRVSDEICSDYLICKASLLSSSLFVVLCMSPPFPSIAISIQTLISQTILLFPNVCSEWQKKLGVGERERETQPPAHNFPPPP